MSKLFYVIGSSGAGKDSIMNYARKNIESERPILFAHRYITRPPTDPTENHVFLSESEFIKRVEGGLFALHWFSHGFYYGIGIEIKSWLSGGFGVVLNGSREYLPQALLHFPHLKTLMIEVSPSILRQRLIQRGRETVQEIEDRMERNQKMHLGPLPIYQLWNNGTLDQSGNEFIRILSET